jgi:hypothetical protein
MHTHGCTDGLASRNKTAAGTRKRMKYANVLKIIVERKQARPFPGINYAR